MTLKRLDKLREEFRELNVSHLDTDSNGESNYSIENCAYNCFENINSIIDEMQRLNIKKL